MELDIAQLNQEAEGSGFHNSFWGYLRETLHVG